MVVGFLTTVHIQSMPIATKRWGVLDTALCDKVCQWLGTGGGIL